MLAGEISGLVLDPELRWSLWQALAAVGQVTDGDLDAELAREHPDRVVAIAIRQLSPGEHVLAHGTPQALDGAGGHDGGRPVGGHRVPVVAGPDGHTLLRRLRRFL